MKKGTEKITTKEISKFLKRPTGVREVTQTP